MPALNGYVSKTLLHESIVEYIHLAGEYDLLFSALEGLFPVQRRADPGLYAQAVCLSVRGEEPPPPQRGWKEEGEGGHPPPPPPSALSPAALLVMVRLGSEPNVTMDAVAAMTRGFLHGHAPDHPVDYFSR